MPCCQACSASSFSQEQGKGQGKGNAKGSADTAVPKANAFPDKAVSLGQGETVSRAVDPPWHPRRLQPLRLQPLRQLHRVQRPYHSRDQDCNFGSVLLTLVFERFSPCADTGNGRPLVGGFHPHRKLPTKCWQLRSPRLCVPSTCWRFLSLTESCRIHVSV